MGRPIEVVLVALLAACLSAVAASFWIIRRDRSRLALAQADLVSYLLGMAGVLSLLPEVLQAFAPELLSGQRLETIGAQYIDYGAYVLGPIGIGIGLARRFEQLRRERLQAVPASL